jgi:hypothetical protein
MKLLQNTCILVKGRDNQWDAYRRQTKMGQSTVRPLLAQCQQVEILQTPTMCQLISTSQGCRLQYQLRNVSYLYVFIVHFVAENVYT